MLSRHRLQIAVAAALLAGCGLVDELSSEDAASYCDESLGGPAASVEVTRARRDDGTIAVAVTKFDARYHQVASLRVDESDGTVEVTWTYRWDYDEDGLIISESFDQDADGRADYSAVSTQDEAGNIVLREIDSNADGVIDHVTIYTYDSEGRRLSSTGSASDGSVLSLTTWTHGENGSYFEEHDDDADGIVDWTMNVFVSSSGKVWTEYDNDADGEPEEIWKATYDEAGRLLGETRDQDADGQPETTYEAVYSPSGEIELEVHGYYSSESTTRYLRDASGRLTSIETTTGETLHHLVTYSYEAGRPLRVSTNFDPDGRVEWRRWEERDDNGRLFREGGDEDGDGRDDWMTTAASCAEMGEED